MILGFIFFIPVFQIVITRSQSPVDTGRKLKVHKTFRKRPRRLLNVLCTFNLRPVSTGSSHNCFVKFFIRNGIWLPQKYFFSLRGVCLFKIFNSQNLCNPLSLFTNTSIDNLSSKSLINVSFEKYLYDPCITVSVIKWKSDKPVSPTHVFWKLWGKLVKVGSIHMRV